MCADNWLAALRAGRDQLGEPGGVPPGASCVVAQNGEVTILDAMNRRRYTLTPAEVAAEQQQQSQSRRPPPRPSRVPTQISGESAAEIVAKAAAVRENDPGPGTLPPPPPASASVPAPASAPPEPSQPVEAPAPVASSDEEPASPRQQQTLAYSAQRADALRREYETARALNAAPQASDAETPSRSNLRALPAVARAPQSSLPPPSALAPQSSIPPPPKLDRLVATRSSQPPRASSDARLVPAFARDVEPTPRSPITYRERAFLLVPPDEHGNLEGLLQTELLKLRSELREAPRGQLIHLAAFDKSLRDAPDAPPIATLEWSDWRGNAVFVSNVERGQAQASSLGGTRTTHTESASSVGEIPAPGSHVAPIPRAPEPRPSEAALAPTEPPPALAPAPAAPVRVPGKSSPWDKLRAAASDASPSSETRIPGENTATNVAVPPAVTAPVAPAPVAPTPEVAPPPVETPPTAPAFPWMNAPLPPSQPTPSAGPVELPPAFQSASQTGGHKTPRDDTGEVDNRLAQAFEALPDLYFLPTPVAGLEFATQLIARIVPCEAISVCLYDINTDEFRFVAVGGPGANERRASAVPSQAGLFGAAKWTLEDAMIIPNVAEDARYQPAVDGRGELEMLNLAYVPLRHGTQLLGMVQLINRGGDRGFTKSDVAVLNYVANQLGEFLASRRSLAG
ncbi:MAG: GAF domain-containing protein [Polyangiales bacterium]